jgi:hypothetical protein
MDRRILIGCASLALVFGLGNPLAAQQPAQEKAKPAASIVYHSQRQNGWLVADSAHFRIFYMDSFTRAKQVLDIAEKTRTKVIEKWLDKDAEPQWKDRCWIVVHPNAQSYSTATRIPVNSPGHTDINVDGTKVISLAVYLHADEANMESHILPHEVTHATIAGQFGAKQIPRWADEGVAVLSEPEDRIKSLCGKLPDHYAGGLAFKAGELMRLKDYPDYNVDTFYAQSVSLVKYLTELKDGQTFAKFMRNAEVHGYDAALKAYYDFDSCDALDRDWKESITNKKKGK